MENIVLTALSEVIGGSTIVSLLALLVGAYVFLRKTNLESKTSLGTLQERQMTGLYNQVHKLTKELVEARNELSHIHAQNMKLLEEVSMASIRIKELETMVQQLDMANKHMREHINYGRRSSDNSDQ